MTTFLELQTALSVHLDDDDSQLYDGDSIKSWINQAITFLGSLGFVRVVASEDDTTAGTLVYEAPSGVSERSQIVRVQVKNTNDVYEDVLYTLVVDSSDLPTSGATVSIELDTDPGNSKMRVIYESPYPTLANNSDVCELPAQLIYLYGAYLAHKWACQQRSQIDRKFHVEERNAALNEFGAIYPRMLPRGESRPAVGVRYA